MNTLDIRQLISREDFLAAAEKAGVSPAWLRRKLGDESISIRDFKALLAESGQDEEQWFRSPLEALNLLEPTPWRADNRPELIRNLVSAARRLPMQEAPLPPPNEAVLDCKSVSRTEIRQLVGDSARALAAVYDLDKYRRQDPERALILVRALATQVAPKLPTGQAQVFAEATGVLAVALRNVGQLAQASEALRIALIAAQKSSLSMTSARLLRRLVIVFRDRFEWDRALLTLDLVATIYLEKGDLVRLTRTIAARGIALTDAARYSEAEVYLKYALATLGDEDDQYRGAMRHNLSIA